MADETVVDPGAAQADPKTVPYDRFREVVTEKNTLRDEIARLKAETQTYAEKAATADTLASQLTKTQNEWQAEKAGWELDRVMIENGVSDSMDRKVARLHYDEIPEAERPKTIADYFTGLRAEGATVPRALAHIFTQAAPTKDAAPARGPMPKPSGGSGNQAPAAPTVYSPEQIKSMASEAKRTGDWSKWDAAKPHMAASQRNAKR